MAMNIIRRNMKHTSHQVHEDEVLRKISGRFYTFEDAGLYILDIAKDGVDTFKQYKTMRHLERDLFQFFSGAKNCVVGLFFFLYALISIPALFFALIDGGFLEQSTTFARNTVGSLAQMLRGATQIVTSPLSLIRIPFRYFAFQGIKDEKFQDRKSIKQLVGDADTLFDTKEDNHEYTDKMKFILDELRRKATDQNDSKKQTCYEGKENISIGVKQTVMFDYSGFFNTHLPNETSINELLKSFRAPTQ